jgi:predicted nucleotidyltransferase
MSLLVKYEEARSAEHVARVRRVMTLRAMLADGMTQREIAAALGVSQPAISQQLRSMAVTDIDAVTAVTAGGPVIRELAEQRGFSDLAVFGSVARGESRPGSDIDLLVRPPEGTTIKGLQALRDMFEQVLGHPVDVVSYGGLKPGIDDDVRREAVLV